MQNSNILIASTLAATMAACGAQTNSAPESNKTETINVISFMGGCMADGYASGQQITVTANIELAQNVSAQTAWNATQALTFEVDAAFDSKLASMSAKKIQDIATQGLPQLNEKDPDFLRIKEEYRLTLQDLAAQGTNPNYNLELGPVQVSSAPIPECK